MVKQWTSSVGLDKEHTFIIFFFSEKKKGLKGEISLESIKRIRLNPNDLKSGLYINYCSFFPHCSSSECFI